MLQGAQRQEVNVEPDWRAPVGRIMLSVVLVVDGAALAERSQAVLRPQLLRVSNRPKQPR